MNLTMTELQEQKNNLLNELDGLFAKIKEEKRAFNDEESTRYDEIEKN